MRTIKSRSLFSLFICNVPGIHNGKDLSRTGAVHYCSRCGIVTQDDRRQGMAITDACRFTPGMKITFGAPGQEYQGIIATVDYSENRIVLSQIKIVPKWRTWGHKIAVAFKSFFRRGR